MAHDEISRIFRAEYGRTVATLIRYFGSIDLAEDAVQEAFEVAIARWPEDGIPPNPGAWITTTARNRGIDKLRRDRRRDELSREAGAFAEPQQEPEDVGPVRDDRLRLIFTCCHPALSQEAQVALTLRLLGGLTTPEIAGAYLVSESTMAARITRAKKKIAAAGIPYRIPAAHDLPDRLSSVLSVLYLIYNEGYAASSGARLTRTDLSAEAIRLSRLLADLMPDEPGGRRGTRRCTSRTGRHGATASRSRPLLPIARGAGRSAHEAAPGLRGGRRLSKSLGTDRE